MHSYLYSFSFASPFPALRFAPVFNARAFMGILLAGGVGMAQAETVGAVDTAFKLIGRNHQVVVEVFDDPKVKGVSCYVSRARTGGVKGTLGLAEDTADASVACRQVGDIRFTEPLKIQEEVFSQSASILFKKIRIVRIADPKRNTLVYLVYSDRLIEGSPQNNVTAVAVPSSLPLPIQNDR
jgi:CreA protein